MFGVRKALRRWAYFAGLIVCCFLFRLLHLYHQIYFCCKYGYEYISRYYVLLLFSICIVIFMLIIINLQHVVICFIYVYLVMSII
jgi:hypothetical protein